MKVFLVGGSFNSNGLPAGRLWLGFNDDAYSGYTVDNSGQVSASVSQSVVPTDQWLVEYYFAPWMDSAPCYRGYDSTTYIFKYWRDAAPDSACPADFSALFRRRVQFAGGTYRFHTDHDDGGRLYLDGTLIIGNDNYGTENVTRNISAGLHELRYEMNDSGGWAKATLWWRGPGALPDVTADPSQWYAEYFPNVWSEDEPPLIQNEGSGFLQHSWSNGPGYGLPADNWSARFQRTVTLTCGKYQFNVDADYGVRLWVDGQKILDEWRVQLASFHPQIDVTAGSKAIRIDYYQGSGGAGLNVNWQQISSCTPAKPWLLMYYLAGDNDLSEPAEQSLRWLQQLTKVTTFNIAVMYDGPQQGDSRYYYIADDVVSVNKAEVDTGDTKTLVDFVNWARNRLNHTLCTNHR